MRKNIMKVGSMVFAASMMMTPVSNVFAADSLQEATSFETNNSLEIFTDAAESTNIGFANPNAIIGNNNSEENLSDSDSESRGLFTTAYVVTASSLNVRSGRGTNYSIIGSLTKGQTVYVYNGSLSNGWVKIKFAGSAGYVSAKYIAKK